MKLFLTALALVLLPASIVVMAQTPQWVAAPGPAKTYCETSTKLPEARLGPQGVWYYMEPPKCRQEVTDKSPTYYIDGRRLIPSQQSVPVGSPCLRLTVIDHFTYGQTADGGSLWALCTLKAKP